MSLHQIGKQAGRILVDKLHDYINEVTKDHDHPPKPKPKPSNPPDHKTHDDSQYPGNQQQPFIPPHPDPLADPSMFCPDDLDSLKFPDEHGNTVPNFSRVGYREGHVRIPFVPVKMEVEPSLDPFSDDTYRIQCAIDAVAAMPLFPIGEHGAQVRGAVLLKAGTYRVKGALIICASGVVLRGEGHDDDGTIVIATGNLERDFILVNGMLTSDMGSYEVQKTKARTQEMLPRNGYKGHTKPLTTTPKDVYVPCGASEIPVLDTKGFRVGQSIVIERPGCGHWICDIGMDDLPCRPDNKQPSTPWTKKTYTFRFERKVVAIDADKKLLTIDIPMVMCLDPKYEVANLYPLAHKHPMITDVGVENMRLDSETDPDKPDDENHGWYAIVMDNTMHGWVTDIKTTHFVSGIFAAPWSRYVTIQDCAVMHPVALPSTGGRRYMFNLSGQMGLVKRCWTHHARHDFITLSRVCGPNVFVDSTGEDANNDSGPHERFAMGILYDNITCRTLNVRQRSWMGSGQGWAGAFHVIYNCTTTGGKCCFQDPPGTKNWIIGLKGRITDKPEFPGPDSELIAHNHPHPIRSLYWAQLVHRMGGDVQAVKSAAGVEGKMQYPPRS